MKVVEILWADAWTSGGDYSIKKAQTCKPIMTTTIGFLVSDNEHGITLAADIYEKDKKNVKIVNFIPHGMIEEYWELEDVED